MPQDKPVVEAMCLTCSFWREIPLGDGEWGRCHRRAPTARWPVSDKEREEAKDNAWVFWPETSATEWCGEWEANTFL